MATTEKRRASAARVRERLDTYLDRSGLKPRSLAVVPLTGDASDRKYFRVLLREAPSLVLALHPDPFTFGELPFVKVAELFSEMPVPVPAIIDHADNLGVLVLQDLGDVTLQAYLGAVQASEHVRLYRQAVAFIEILQRRGAELASRDYPPYRMAFDVEKLLWELDFFTTHFVENFRGLTIAPADREALQQEWQWMAEELASEPRVLCHRDYHSRNLMLSGGEMYIIDFQDARLGPDTYDLVSLLRDSYVDLPDEAIDELISHFLALKREGAPGGFATGWESEFRPRFELMGLQRNLKALGTFAYQTVARSNPVYLQYIPRSLRFARRTMAGDARFARLHAILGALVEEIA